MSNPDNTKRGIVIEGKGAQVRVKFDDNDGMISPWLDVMQATTKGAKIYTRPKPGSLVICALDEKWESGTVLGAIYSDADPAPADSDAEYHQEMGDGSTFVYRNGTWTVTNAGGAVLTMSGNDLTIAGNLNVSYDGGSFSVNGNIISITGNVSIQGNLEVSGTTSLQDTTINGVEQINN